MKVEIDTAKVQARFNRLMPGFPVLGCALFAGGVTALVHGIQGCIAGHYYLGAFEIAFVGSAAIWRFVKFMDSAGA